MEAAMKTNKLHIKSLSKYLLIILPTVMIINTSCVVNEGSNDGNSNGNSVVQELSVQLDQDGGGIGNHDTNVSLIPNVVLKFSFAVS